MTGLDFIIRESEPEYRKKAKIHLSSHALGDFRKCPLLYQRKKLGLIPDHDRPAYLLGRAAHKLILEGVEFFDKSYAVGGPVNPNTGKPYGTQTKAYTEWAAAQGKDVLTDSQHALIKNLTAGVDAHPEARSLLSGGVAEGTVRIEYCGLPCQSRLDYFNPEKGVVDLKTCDDLTWFEADARRYSYTHQFAFYQAVVKQATGLEFPVHVIAVEKKEPFRCGVWLIHEQVLASARNDNEAAIERLKECENSGTWPTGYEERRVFDYV